MTRFTRSDLDKKELTFNGKTYKIGTGSLKLSELTNKGYSLKTTSDGKVYAYDKLNHMVYRTR
uniref:Uncharacterized protein n=1 Tax=uncultured marine virus TaxID=186617 RepID=A0A0F7L7W3_9VIRU|nr:hypothetical protein [uncultured marine virus]